MNFNFRHELGKITPKLKEGAKIYIFCAYAHWDYICRLHKYLVDVNIDECIEGFIDNDIKKQGTLFHGKTVYALADIDLNNSVIIIAAHLPKTNMQIALQLKNSGMFLHHSCFMEHTFMLLLMRYEYERFLQFKDKHKGRRCFIIGNGSSLTASDLDKLENEITFATNKIYLMFDKTKWRPSYYMIHDDDVLKQTHNEINNQINCPVFYAFNSIMQIDDFALTNKYYYFLDGRVDWKPSEFAKPEFSKEPFVLQWGATITYDCLQLAAYMGFSEIYLLGVDFNHSLMINSRGEIIQNNCNNHFSLQYGTCIYNPLCDIIENAYKSAQDYAESHGIKIYKPLAAVNLRFLNVWILRVCLKKRKIKMKKVLITTSSFGNENAMPLKLLKDAGFDFVLNPYKRKVAENELLSLLSEHKPKYLIAGTESIRQRTLELAKPFLRMISRCGTGVDNVDLPAAQEMGISVANTPDAPTRAVAELTVGVILDLLRGISESDRDIRQGKFDKRMGNLLFEKTVGIVGCGRIGTATAELLRAFGCKVLGYDKYIDSHKTIEMASFEFVLENADILSLHLPFSNENKHIINISAIEKMKDGVIILNISRGGLVDEEALYDALNRGKIKAAGLDCFEEEPYKGSLVKLPNVVLTPHIGSYAIETRIEQEIAAVKNILEHNENE